MSRSGRANDLLSDWRDHPRGCTAAHGWRDGYDGPCTDDPQEILDLIEGIDPSFRSDRIIRLEALVRHLGGQSWLDRLETDYPAVRRELDEMAARSVPPPGPSGVSAGAGDGG